MTAAAVKAMSSSPRLVPRSRQRTPLRAQSFSATATWVGLLMSSGSIHWRRAAVSQTTIRPTSPMEPRRRGS